MQINALLDEEIPPTEVLRARLVRTATELALLKQLVPLAARRDKERERLTLMGQQAEGASHASCR